LDGPAGERAGDPEPGRNHGGAVRQYGEHSAIGRREQTFRIVGEDEADPAKGTISHASPLARALIGKSVGDVGPLGTSEVEIRAIQ